MKLITEEISNAEYIVEEKNGKKNYAIKGIFMQSDVKNRNGRIYPKEILQKEVVRFLFAAFTFPILTNLIAWFTEFFCKFLFG